ncbi:MULTISPECIES: RNA repair transcriptional activator RtcR [Acidovorax]|uniref:RNA repair transcriptional activator RtcR n=1 Tax=Acidovorax facilis TaxID=12917 RepID=A0ABV8D9L9_9BURK|nr:MULTISPECIES: RNA repair transcriptional activator RtcR [Acidovorax]KQB57580.1 transcriptional regulator [Acidovorax sp. SD340]MBO1008053.1 sigma 54-interacting transcriptional regulator [Acidovorax sp. SD340]MCO4241230.1 RNA repair transcriptional activator RtcR [Acidovorax facilis]
MRKNKVVIGFLGTQLDSGRGAGRWEKWRPTVSLVQHEDVVIERLELLYTPPHQDLAQQVRVDMVIASPETTVNLVPLPIADPWDFGEVYAKLFDWARGYRFDTEREEYWTHITTGTHVAQICLFLLVESRRIPGVLVQTSPPKRQKMGNPGSYALIDLDLSRYDVIAQRFGAEQQDAVQFLKSGIATRNARFNALIDEVERVAVRSRAPILFTGPTGAGKSHLARRMFELKKSRHQVEGEFVEVNCATLHGDGAASTLFGHKKGAFTGAAADRAGLLRTAHKGVLFLDEIGELGLDEQAMLLKAVEEKRFYPMGSDREVASDFELIAGTNRDLRTEVAAGRFREDLYARINLWSYVLPGLAQRPEDIEPNVDHQLARAGAELGRSVRFSNEARVAYLRYAQSPEALWTGNFRDLSASVTRLATLADSGRIGLPLVEAEMARLRWLWQPASDARNGLASTPGALGRDDLAALLGEETVEAMDLFDRLQLAAVLQVCSQARTLSDAGRLLFQVSRTQRTVVNDADRLRKYLARFGLDWERLTSASFPSWLGRRH